jgi:hypothetical protein
MIVLAALAFIVFLVLYACMPVWQALAIVILGPIVLVVASLFVWLILFLVIAVIRELFR